MADAWHPVHGRAAATDKHDHFKLSCQFVFLENKAVKAVYFCNLCAVQLVDPFHVLTDFICLCLSLVINCLGFKQVSHSLSLFIINTCLMV